MNYKKIYIIITVCMLVLVSGFVYKYSLLLSGSDNNSEILPITLTDQEKLDILYEASGVSPEIDDVVATGSTSTSFSAIKASTKNSATTKTKTINTTSSKMQNANAGASSSNPAIGTTTSTDTVVSYEEKQAILNQMNASAETENGLSEEEKLEILNQITN